MESIDLASSGCAQEVLKPTENYALEEDIKSISEQMQRVLEFCEQQTQNPIRMHAQINSLRRQLHQAIAEKNHWEKRYNELSEEYINVNSSLKRDVQPVRTHPRRSSTAELKIISDTFDTSRDSNLSSDDCDSDSDGSTNDGSSFTRAPFRLLQCSDEQCEVFTPMNRSIRTQHRARNNIQFMWDERPSRVLVIKKPNEPDVTKVLIGISEWLTKTRDMVVYLEPAVHRELNLEGTVTWKDADDWEELQFMIDFVVSLGGDGTVLWVSSLFNKSVPPVISFAMGSLGFLTPFESDRCFDHLDAIIKGGFHLSLRSRLVGAITRHGEEQIKLPPLHALNEIVIDRGPKASLVELNCFCDGLEITRIAADGIIIATPTGSTAYSLSAGGSMTHPSVPTMLFTPICPHTLSFRPLLFHDSATLKIEFPVESRASTACVSFDGKNRVVLERGDSVTVRVSSFPLPSICRRNENQDWFESMITNLNWNQRRAQKPWTQVDLKQDQQ